VITKNSLRANSVSVSCYKEEKRKGEKNERVDESMTTTSGTLGWAI